MHDATKDILDGLLRIIYHLSDKDYQLRIWIRGEGPQCDDYDENIDIFFMKELISSKTTKNFTSRIRSINFW